ncbi:MAG: hypothetical protein HGN29_00220 [Asgard group archaeon]|nr:hypothetical protein [Asgard group archaeon]
MNLLKSVKKKSNKRGWSLLDASFINTLKFEEIFSSNDFAKFGDSVVNFIYNAAIFEAQTKLQGIKVWDSCLAEACKKSPLRSYIGSRKNKGELGDAVEAFIGYIYLTHKFPLNQMIDILAKYLKHRSGHDEKNEQELCSAAFIHLVNHLCDKLGIVDKLM